MGKQPQRYPTKATEVAPELTKEELDKVSGGSFNGFVNFGDIKGESTDKDHKDWVMILSYQWKPGT